MSQIDQAFIQAYTPEDQPHARQASESLPSAEPIPAPHFSMSTSQVVLTSATAYEDTAAMQRELLNEESSVVEFAAPAIESTSQRRPLSTFAAPEQAPTTSFQPVFEVDGFRWPETVRNLLAEHHSLLNPVVEQLVASSEAGRSMVGIAGLRSGVGSTTVLLCLARLLSESGKSVSIVDGNFEACELARTLGLEFEIGWEDVLSGKVPLAESVVHSLDDQISLLPLNGANASPRELLASIQTSVSAGVLRYHYDVVLFDLGTPSEGKQLSAVELMLEHCRLDASILVADTEANDAESVQTIDQMMSLLGESCLGLIGNVATFDKRPQ